MAARRPRNPDLPSRKESIEKAMQASADDPSLPGVEAARAQVRESVIRESLAAAGIPYASIRTIKTPGKLRQSHVNLIEATDGNTITFRSSPYPHFLVMPGGTEIPIWNVAGAVAVGSEIAQKLSRTERLAKRKAALEEKMGARVESKSARAEPLRAPTPKARKGVQEVPSDEDDVDDSLDEDELDDATEGEASDE